MSEMEQLVLSCLATDGVIEDSWSFCEARGLDHQVLVGVQKSLLGDAYTQEVALSTTLWSLTSEGEEFLRVGSPEFRVYQTCAAGDGGSMDMTALQDALGEVCKIGLGPCMKSKWLAKKGDTVNVVKQGVTDETATALAAVRAGQQLPGDKDLEALKKRKLVNKAVRKSLKITKGAGFREKRVKKSADLTKEMLEGGSWGKTEFKSVNLKAMGAPVGGGGFHPLLKVRNEFRMILMQMGFEEMPTNKWVESSFWNFDSLFQPQSHPARDAHDTFFMKGECGTTRSFPEDYYEKVRDVHENGGFESIGYGCNFKREEASKNLLRTHTTAISAQMLYKLANQEGGFQPKKYFSIDRVFRNEAMDATHLCEFHQVEGVIADRNLTLGNLIGTIKTFFEKLGLTNLRFKPAYNPYTEPSMEIFGYHPELKKWTEIGNSGMFRPEMLRPMGLPEDVRVIAWGLSLERPTMIKYKIENIRDLFGHKADILSQKNAPIARF
jgi:phenylalanyl-tRNA synthetase alpha chain